MILPILGGVAFVGAFSWLWWETSTAPDAKDALPQAHQCCRCGDIPTEQDHWLIENGARISHGLCRNCVRAYEQEIGE